MSTKVEKPGFKIVVNPLPEKIAQDIFEPKAVRVDLISNSEPPSGEYLN